MPGTTNREKESETDNGKNPVKVVLSSQLALRAIRETIFHWRNLRDSVGQLRSYLNCI